MSVRKALLALFVLGAAATCAAADASAQSRRHCSGWYGTIIPRFCLEHPAEWRARAQKRRLLMMQRRRQLMQQSGQYHQ
jgi:hypothetical protein